MIGRGSRAAATGRMRPPTPLYGGVAAQRTGGKRDAIQGAVSAAQLVTRNQLVDPEAARIAVVGRNDLEGLHELAVDQLRRLGRRQEAGKL